MISTYDPGSFAGTTEYGGLVKMLVSTEESNLRAGTFRLKPGEALVPDVHDSDEVFYVMEGELHLRARDGDEGARDGDEEHHLRQGQVALIPRQVVHLSSNRSDQDVEVFWCFSVDLIRESLRR